MKRWNKLATAVLGCALVFSAGAVAGMAHLNGRSNAMQVSAGTTGTATLPGTQRITKTATAVGGDGNILIKASSENTYSNPNRIYKGTKVTITTASSDVLITSVAYTASSSGDYYNCAKSATVSPSATPSESGLTLTWSYSETANVTTWEFTAKDGQTRCSSIVVNYVNNGTAKDLESVSCADINLRVGETKASALTFTPSDASNKTVSYAITAGTDVASVDANGVVTGLKEGTATLTVTPADTHAAATTATITVSPALTNPVVLGKSYAITATHETGNYELTSVASKIGAATVYATEPTFNYVFEACQGSTAGTFAFKHGDSYLGWNTSTEIRLVSAVDEASSWTVAVTNGNTVVSNKKDSSRKLMFSYNGGSNPRFAAYASTSSYIYPNFVEMPEIPLTDFSLSDLSVHVNQSSAVKTTYTPTNASDKTLNWAVANSSVATVNNGVVTGVSVGSTTVTASKEINGQTVSRTVNVTVRPSVVSHAGTEADPYTVEEAVIVGNDWATGTYTKENAYVKGLITGRINTSASYLNLWVGDTLANVSAETDAFELFKVANETTESIALLKVGATVVAKGNITLYNGTAEFEQNCTIEYNSYEEADTLADLFLDAAADLCANAGSSTLAPTNFVEEWNTAADLYADLADVEKAHFVSATADSTGDNVEKMVSIYDYCVAKYTNLTEFITGRTVVRAAYKVNNTDDSSALIAVSVAAMVGITLAGGFFFYNKKRKQF